MKGHSHSSGAPHPFTSPPPLLNRACTIAAWSWSPTASAPPPRYHLSPGERSPDRASSHPSHRHPRSKPRRPRAAIRPSSGEHLPSASVESTVEPWTGQPCTVHRAMDRVHDHFLLENNLKIEYSSNFSFRPLPFPQLTCSPHIYMKPLGFLKIILNIALATSKIYI
jgi:hypothetical protein